MNDRYKLRNLVGDEKRLERFHRFMDPAGLVTGGRITPNWMHDGASFWYADGKLQDTTIRWVNGETGQAAPIGADDVSPVDPCVGEAARSEEISSPRFYRRPFWLMEPMLVTEAPAPDQRWFASLKDGNIMLRSPIDDCAIPLTMDGTADFAWDIEAPRWRSTACGRREQHLLDPWSPDGNRLFAIKVDRRAVPELPFIRYLGREEELGRIRIQRVGGPIDTSYPHVIDVLSRHARRFDLGDTEDQYFTLIGWLPDGSEVLFTRHSRDFKTVDVLAGNPVNGSVRAIVSESARTFVATQLDVIASGDNHITVLEDGSGLIWRSSRSGWNHLYLYAIDGTLVRALTRGEFPVIDVVAVDLKADWVYFMAHPDQSRPYDTHLCRVRLAGGQIERLTPLDGQNVVSLSPSKKTFTVINSRPDRPFRTDFYICDGTHLTTVQQANVSGVEALGYVAPEEFTVLAADRQTELWGIMYKPPDFDPGKKYPLIDHLYGGPQVAFVNREFGFGEDTQQRLNQALAQLGYIVISVDARGTPERSKAFQDVVYRNWGRHEIPDHAATIQQLAQRHSFIDPNRVGVWGHSWGGYFTVRALAQAPETFHVGVAAAPGSDVYDSILYEPYLDLPARAKTAYEYASNHQWMSRITGKLMMVVGSCDASIYSNTLRMTHCLIEAGVDHELVVLPEAGHNFARSDEEYFIRKLVSHFEVHLKPRKSG